MPPMLPSSAGYPTAMDLFPNTLDEVNIFDCQTWSASASLHYYVHSLLAAKHCAGVPRLRKITLHFLWFNWRPVNLGSPHLGGGLATLFLLGTRPADRCHASVDKFEVASMARLARELVSSFALAIRYCTRFGTMGTAVKTSGTWIRTL